MKKRYSMLTILIIIASFILFSLVFRYWDAIKQWIF